MIIKDITELIGNTPMLEINEEVHGIKNLKVFAKLEYLNPFGSLKDRIAWGMIKDDLKEIKKNQKTVIESSSGNTSKALSIICSKEGVTFHNYTNRIKEKGVRDILQILGSNITEFPGVLECRPSNPNDRNDPKFVALELERSNPDKYHYTKQYQNEKNPESQKKMGEEIAKGLEKVDYFFGFLGTTGSSRGAGEVLKEKKDTSIIGIVSEEEEYIPGGRSLTEMWETGFFKKEFYESIQACSVNNAIDGMLKLQRKAGLLVGPTAGATYQSLVNYFKDKELSKETVAVFIACDRVEVYNNYIRENRPSLFTDSKDKKSVSEITNDQVLTHSCKTKETKNHQLIVDLRPSILFKSESIPNSINISYQYLKPIIEEENIFENFDDILFICSNGKVSSKISAYLNMTYNKKTNYLEGGFKELKLKN